MTRPPSSSTTTGRIAAVFGAGRAARRPLVIPFVTAGFPEREATVPIVRALAEAGADAVEIGVPFSDPLADGATIQRSSEVALREGMSTAAVLEIVRELRRGGRTDSRTGSAEGTDPRTGSTEGTGSRTGRAEGTGSRAGADARPGAAAAGLPLILMGYCNPLFAYGLERFLDDAADAGVDGLIIADLPPEEAGNYRDGCIDRGLSATFLVAPNAPDQRIRIVDEASTHFSYCVTVTGVTGARSDIQQRTLGFLERMRRLAKKPFVVGFGVKEPEHVLRLGPRADGVVIGSALIDAMSAAAAPAAAAAALVAPLRQAADAIGAGAGKGDPGGERD